MPVQMIELEEVQMIDLSDEALEATLGGELAWPSWGFNCTRF